MKIKKKITAICLWFMPLLLSLFIGFVVYTEARINHERELHQQIENELIQNIDSLEGGFREK